MASPYNPGLRNATALGLAMGAEAAGVTAGVKNALALGAAIGASGAGTTAGVKNALAMAAAIGDKGQFLVGVTSFANASTTRAVAHGMTLAPDFIMCFLETTIKVGTGLDTVANTTTITFTRTTTTNGEKVHFILGSTA